MKILTMVIDDEMVTVLKIEKNVIMIRKIIMMTK